MNEYAFTSNVPNAEWTMRIIQNIYIQQAF